MLRECSCRPRIRRGAAFGSKDTPMGSLPFSIASSCSVSIRRTIRMPRSLWPKCSSECSVTGPWPTCAS